MARAGRRYTEEWFIAALKEAEAGPSAVEVIRRHGITPHTFNRWKAKYAGVPAAFADREPSCNLTTRSRPITQRPKIRSTSSSRILGRSPVTFARTAARSFTSAALVSVPFLPGALRRSDPAFFRQR